MTPTPASKPPTNQGIQEPMTDLDGTHKAAYPCLQAGFVLWLQSSLGNQAKSKPG